MGEFALEEGLLPCGYGTHGQRLRRSHRAGTYRPVTIYVPVGRCGQFAIWTRPLGGKKRANVQNTAAHDEQQRRLAKTFAGHAFKFRTSSEEHWPDRRRRPPCHQVWSSRDHLIGQELHRATGPQLPGQLPQAGCAKQLSGPKNRTSIAVFLDHAMDGRHEAVSMVIPVKQYGLVQLQFEFAADVDAESHRDFSRFSIRVLIRTVRTSTRISTSMTANAWRTLAGSFGRRGTIRLGSGVSWPQYSHSSSKHAMTASPGRKYSRMAGRGRSREW